MELVKKTTEANLSNLEKPQSSILKVEDVIKSDSPTLARLNKDEPEKLKSALNALISDVALFMNVGKQMTPKQVVETSELICGEFYFLKIDDLKIFFAKFKSGAYGQLYDRLDGQVIMSALRQYVEDRMVVAEQVVKELDAKAKKEESDELYWVKINDNYIKNSRDSWEEVTKKELASKFIFKHAVFVKKSIQSDFPNEKVTVNYVERPDIGLIDYLKEHKPEIAKEITKKEDYVSKSTAIKHEFDVIDEDESLSLLEKENKKRAIVYLEPLTEKEFQKRQELLTKNK